MRFRNLVPIVAAVFAIATIQFALSTNSSKSADEGPSLLQAGATDLAPPPLPAQASDEDVAPQGAEVQTRGPIHEAFAAPIDFNPQPAPVINKRPPDPIEEVPPDATPEGENVIWINGYWAWDDDRNDFLWISGVFRNAPKYQSWVAGYWSEVPAGYQWTPGFWATTANGEVNYVPEPPPPSREEGPSSPQPSENHFWIPGNYVYRDVRYAWQPGYWAPCQPNWVWVPAHWSWTPAGYVFVNGFWDFPVERRGCLFAPIYFSQPVYAQPAFVYTPSVLINVGSFNDCLFVRPAYCRYYYGDYFAAQYATVGFRPWCSVGVGFRGGIGVGVGYDPLFVYYNWNNSRRDRNWLARTQNHFELLRNNPADRPPHTFVAQQQLLKKTDPARRSDLVMAATIQQATKNPTDVGGVKLHQISQRDRQQFVTQSKEFKQVSQERSKLEKDNAVTGLGGPRGPDGLIGKGPNDAGNVTGGGAGAGGNAGGDAGMKMKTLKLPTMTSTKTNLAGGGAGDTAGSKGSTPGGANAPGDRRFNALNQQNKGTLQDRGKTLGGNAVVQNPNDNGNPTFDKKSSTLGQGNQTNQPFTPRSGRANLSQQNDAGNVNPDNITPRTGPGRTFSAPRDGSFNAGVNGGTGGPTGGNPAGAGGANGTPNTLNLPKGGVRSLNPSGGNATGGGDNGGAGGTVGRSGPAFQGPSGGLQGPSNPQRSFIQPGGSGAGGSGGGSPQTRALQAQPQQKSTPPAAGGGGGGGGQKQDNDDSKKKKTSDATSPRTDMDLMPRSRSVVDIRGTLDSQQAPNRSASQTAKDIAMQDRSSQTDRDTAIDPFSTNQPGDVSRRKSSTNSGAARPLNSFPSLRTNNLQPIQLGASNSNSGGAASGSPRIDLNKPSNDRGSRGVANPQTLGSNSPTPNSDASGSNSSGSPSIRPGLDPRTAKIPSVSRYDYDSLLKRGQSLSLNTGLGGAGGGSPATSDSETTRRLKDPVGSFGLGNAAGRSMYGPGGLTGPSGSGADSSTPRGSGSYISPDSLPQLQKFQRGGNYNTGGTGKSLSTPESRTYDPRTN
jgi:hypothetical protein